MRLKTRRPSLLPLDVVHHGWWGGQFGHGGMVAASLGNGGPDVFWDPRVATFGARGRARLCSRVEPRGRERLGGFWWDSEGSDGLPRGPPPLSFSASRLVSNACIFACQCFVFDDLWRD